MGSTNKLDDRVGIDAGRVRPAFLAVAGTAVGTFGRLVLDALLPPRCVSCGQEVARGHGLCAACWGGLTFIDAPLCVRCGLPFDFEAPATSLCGPCVADPPPFDQARAALVYDEGSRSLILGFKHGDRTDRALILARLMARPFAAFEPPVDMAVPVPLHRWRLWRRRYNQAALLAQAMAADAKMTYRPDILSRTKATPSQAGRGAKDRQRNVRGAFSVSQGAKSDLAGRHVLLVDDVMTTGATVRECARVLKRSGAATVRVVVIARAVMPSRVD